MHLNHYPHLKSIYPTRQTNEHHFQEFLKMEMSVTGVFPGKKYKAQFVNLVLLRNFATFTEERMVSHSHFISCDADSLVLFLGLII